MLTIEWTGVATEFESLAWEGNDPPPPYPFGHCCGSVSLDAEVSGSAVFEFIEDFDTAMPIETSGPAILGGNGGIWSVTWDLDVADPELDELFGMPVLDGVYVYLRADSLSSLAFELLQDPDDIHYLLNRDGVYGGGPSNDRLWSQRARIYDPTRALLEHWRVRLSGEILSAEVALPESSPLALVTLSLVLIAATAASAKRRALVLPAAGSPPQRVPVPERPEA